MNKIQIDHKEDKDLSSLELINKYGTKSSAIRSLNQQNFTRKEIALLLNIRYQHVRNVLITPIKNPKVIK